MHIGPTVASVSFQQLQGAYLARGAVEALSADISTLSELNSRFHPLIAEATGYDVLRDITDQLLLAVRRYRAVAPLDTENWRRVVREHVAILEALRGRDPSAARKAVTGHMASQATGETEPAGGGEPITTTR